MNTVKDHGGVSNNYKIY